MPPLSPEASLAVGVIVGLLSTCVQSVGLTLQRKSHLEDEKKDFGSQRPAYRRRRWQIGMLLFLIANIVGSTIQITTLPLPLLSTLQASGLVFNSILACLLLKEPWTWRTAYGTILVAAGAVLVSYFSALPEPNHSLKQLLVLLSENSFLIWFILSLVLVVGVLVSTYALRSCIAHHHKGTPRLLLINGMSFGMVSGILSAHALLLAKSAVELIVRSVTDHKNQFKTYQPWLLVLAFVFLALAQLYYLHLGLKLISTSVLYPFVFCIYNLVAILDGLIYFRQMDRLPPLHAGLIALGTVLLLSGVLTLSWRIRDDEADRNQVPMAKPEIPQTLLAPGLGFVGDPDSESGTETDFSAPTEDELDSEIESNERTALVQKSLHRSRTTTHNIPRLVPGLTGRKRRRAATLKEVIDIWDALEDSGRQYGTIRRPTSSASNPSRPTTSSILPKQRPRRASQGKLLGSPSINKDDGPLGNRQAFSRRSTMPDRRRSRSITRRRRSTHLGQGSALFSDMLKSDWWRTKRKEDGGDDEPLDSPHEEDGNASSPG